MLATSQNVRKIGSGLDHPECVCTAPDGTVYAGGEAGQLYRLAPNGTQTLVANTGGFLLGIALDGNGCIHACDQGRKAVMRIDPDGRVIERSGGFEIPNYGVFDAAGNLFVSDSGDYWNPTGTGKVYILRPDNTKELFHAGPFKFANGLAIDPTGRWLYVAQSTAWNVVRIPVSHANGSVEKMFQLPEHRVVDGLAFTADGGLIITCFHPDEVYLGYPDGRLELLIEDPAHALLISPTNAALHGSKLYLANFGGRFISVLDVGLQPGPVYHPRW